MHHMLPTDFSSFSWTINTIGIRTIFGQLYMGRNQLKTKHHQYIQ